MPLPLTWRLGWRYLRSRQREGFISITSWFAIIGIALGVATLILVTSLMNGIRSEMRDRFLGIDGHIVISSPYRGFADYEALASTLRDIPQISTVTPKIEGQVMATAKGRALGIMVAAMPETELQKRPLIANAMTLGDLPMQSGIIIGSRLARNLGVTIGDSITLISPQGTQTFAGFVPRMKNYTVVGTFTLGMHLYDGSLAFLPFAEAQTFFRLENAVSNLEIMLQNSADATAIASQIQQKLPQGFEALDWQRRNVTVFSALAVQRNVMTIILALIVLVAAFNIISSLVMLVKEKRGEIAILRTIGASRRQIMHIFIFCGVWLGAVGTLAGLGLGLLLAANIDRIRHGIEALIGQELLPENIYFLSTLPTETNPKEVVVVVLVSLALSFLATLYPARKAAQLQPAEVLRDE